MRRLLAVLALCGAALVFQGASCRPKPPNPIPTPTPPVDPTAKPAKGTPIAPEILLRPAPGAKVTSNGTVFLANMAVGCCRTFTVGGVEKNGRWPMASKDFMDYTAEVGGTNMWHFRLGPFIASPEVESEWVDVGGAYKPGTLEWNPKFWEEVTDLAWHAHKKHGGFVEVAVIDTWGCKYSQAGNEYMPWPKAEIDACGRRPSPEAERYIRKAVEELGCYGNVIWSTDVEGGNIQGVSPDWFLWVQRVIRDEEQKSGCGFVHMVGTNSRLPEVEGQVDYVQTHERTTLSGPIAGRWTLNNERNPEFPVQVEVANGKVARDLGLAYAAWRAGMDEATFQQVLEGFKAVFAGAGPPPPAGGCYAPGPDDPKWVTNPPPLTPQQRAMQLGAQVSAAKDAVGDRCGKNIQESLALVAGKLREQGLCASGPWVDAVVARAPDGLWEEHHVVAYSSGCFTSTANGYKGAWTYSGAPPVASCGDPVPPRVSKWKGPVKHNNWYDSTPLIQGCDYCAAIGMGDIGGVPRCECPTRNEGDPQRPPCEAVAVGGAPLWRCDQGDPEVRQGNPFQARCGGGAWIEVCHADGQTCSRSALS